MNSHFESHLGECHHRHQLPRILLAVHADASSDRLETGELSKDQVQAGSHGCKQLKRLTRVHMCP